MTQATIHAARTLVLLGGALAVYARATPGPAPPTGVPRAAREAIGRANAEWLQGMEREDTAAVVRAYADDAVFVTPSGVVLSGRAAIARFTAQRFAANGRALRGTISDDGMTRAGALIYEWGHATLQMESGGTPKRSSGRFLTVWAAAPDGAWRITRNLAFAF